MIASEQAYNVFVLVPSFAKRASASPLQRVGVEGSDGQASAKHVSIVRLSLLMNELTEDSWSCPS